MRRSLWILCLAVILTVWLENLSVASQVGDLAVSPLPATLAVKPYVQDVTETSVAIVWETTDAVVGTVDYGQTDVDEFSVSETTPTRNHRVAIQDLEAGQIYQYRVQYANTQLDPSKFMTAEVDEHLMPEEPTPDGLYIWPYLQNVTQHSIVVMWETDKRIIGTVEYGKTESLGSSVSESIPATIHEVLLSDLEPGSRYHYQVSYGDTCLSPSTFRTAPPDGTREAKILLYGDSRSYPKRHRRVVERMLPFEPDIIINSGDLVASGQEYEQWKPQHFWPLKIVSDHIPIYTCPGNHERNSKHYFNYVSLPGNEVYYSFDYANIHFVALDSNARYTPYDQDSPQYRWLESDLAQHQEAEWIIVFLHHPLFRVHPGRGIETQRYTWQSLFDKYGVDLVVAGHDHHYGRIRPIGSLTSERRNGVTYITTGGGGASLYDVTEDRPYIAMARKLHNIVELTVHGSTAEAVVTDIHGNHVETFALDKKKTTDPQEYISYEVFEIERDLRDAVNELEPIIVESEGAELEIHDEIRVPTNFDVRLEGEIQWHVGQVEGLEENGPTDLSTAGWVFDAPNVEFAINPGADLHIPLRGRATYPNVYPVPSLSIHFSKIVGRLPVGFRNNRITFHPLKIAPRIPVVVPRVYPPLLVANTMTGIHLNGMTDEVIWQGAVQLNRFTTEQGDTTPQRTTQVRLLHDGTYLYVAAHIEAETEDIEEILARNIQNRDDRYIMRGEYFGVYIGTPEAVYGFGVDPHGAQVDARNSDLGWNLAWAAHAIATDQGWQVELAIPVVAILDQTSEFIGMNIVRWDNHAKQASMLTPTFTLRGTENRLPEYAADMGNYQQFPVLILQPH